MNGAFYIGATGLDAQQRALDVVANNIANINTMGFKRSAVRFSEMVMQSRPAAENEPVMDPLPQISPAGVNLLPPSHIWSQGDLRSTGSQLDIAIDGEGFLEMMGPQGRTLLWRGGALKVNEDGYLAAADGTILQAMISVPRNTTSLAIGRDGLVTAVVDGSGASERIGQLQLVMVTDKESLAPVGGGYYENTGASNLSGVIPGEEGAGFLAQGTVETANVQLSEEMVTLLLLQRAYAANAQVVQAGDQIMSIANNLRR